MNMMTRMLVHALDYLFDSQLLDYRIMCRAGTGGQGFLRLHCRRRGEMRLKGFQHGSLATSHDQNSNCVKKGCARVTTETSSANDIVLLPFT